MQAPVPATKWACLKMGLDEGHNAYLYPVKPSVVDRASWAMQVAPTLRVGHPFNSKVYGQEEERILFCASGSPIGRNLS